MLLSILTTFDVNALTPVIALSHNTHPSFTLSMGQLVGCAILVFSLMAIAISSHRYLLLYGLAGMGYWLLIEALQSVITFLLPISSWNGYIAALAISWSPLYIWLFKRALKDTADLTGRNRSRVFAKDFTNSRHTLKSNNQQSSYQDTYIEHTPIYDDDYRPKFQ